MIGRIFRDYREATLSKGLALLYTNRTLGTVAGGLSALFLPVYLYQKFDLSIYNVILIYIFDFGVQYFLILPGAKMMNRLGIKKSIIFSTPFICLFYLCLFFIEKNVLVMTLVGYLFLGVYKALYWVPYHTSYAKFSHTGRRGREASMLSIMSDVIEILVPIVSSFMIVNFGYGYLFLMALFVQILSIIPTLMMPAVNEKFNWSYGETYRQIFSKKHRPMFWAYFGDGMQSMAGMIIWPIFIWLLFSENYQTVGWVTATIILAGVVIRVIIGDFTDRFSQKKVLKTGTYLYSIGWILKMFVVSTFHVFAISVYHNFATILMRTSFDSSMYDKAADWGHYTDEYSVAREMILNFGRVASMLLMMGLLYFFPMNIVFIVSAIGALFMNALLHHVEYEMIDQK